MAIISALLLVWLGCSGALWLWRRELFSRTWHEPYVAGLALVIESDDWGPGESFHTERLDGLSGLLGRYSDSTGRTAMLTAGMVLAAPDTRAIREKGYSSYVRRYLDRGFELLLEAFRRAMQAGTLVPQLHGLEHYYGEGLIRLAAANDERVLKAFRHDEWSDWESLDSPLQGHYVDGTRLPTTPLPRHEQQETVNAAAMAFQRMFGISSSSTVAPCYLWNDTTESIWYEHGIRFIQTAGYRCAGRGEDRTYIQDKQLIRPGDQNDLGQVYLVRNAMYEPVDGRGDDSCMSEIKQAQRQGLPAVISMHRYNFTRSRREYEMALAGLDRLLSTTAISFQPIRYLSSPELGAWFAGDDNPITDPVTGKSWPELRSLTGLEKTGAFLFRLWYRHAKLRLVTLVTGLIIPLGIFALSSQLWRRFT
ncbi:hypothetical protein N9H39_00820 [Gammaproteobacteria bacterium]|nr:hypothetical protein [Gammaproteobacteria bacterium]